MRRTHAALAALVVSLVALVASSVTGLHEMLPRYQVAISDLADSIVWNLRSRGVPVEEYPGLDYSCVGLIHPRFTRGATGDDGTSATRDPKERA